MKQIVQSFSPVHLSRYYLLERTYRTLNTLYCKGTAKNRLAHKGQIQPEADVLSGVLKLGNLCLGIDSLLNALSQLCFENLWWTGSIAQQCTFTVVVHGSLFLGQGPKRQKLCYLLFSPRQLISALSAVNPSGQT